MSSEAPEDRVARMVTEAIEHLGDHGVWFHHDACLRVEGLSDEHLDYALDETRTMLASLKARVPFDVAVTVGKLLAPLVQERDRRDDRRELEEANGHLVMVGTDWPSTTGGRRVWYALCVCVADKIGTFETYEDAMRAAGNHAADHDGRWEASPSEADLVAVYPDDDQDEGQDR